MTGFDDERLRLDGIAGSIELAVKERKLHDEANRDARFLRNLADDLAQPSSRDEEVRERLEAEETREIIAKALYEDGGPNRRPIIDNYGRAQKAAHRPAKGQC